MITSIELQVISKILTTDDEYLQAELLSFDSSYYSVFKPHIEFILNHKSKFNDVPDVFTFQAEFPDVTLVSCNESIEYLTSELKKNKQHIMLLETFNKLKDLGSGDVSDAWQYLSLQCDKASRLESSEPMNIIKDAQKRADQVVEYAKQTRIPTGFPEIDKLMYGGLSTVEEFAIIAARTNSGKTWILTKMMESAQANGFPVLYYSPEMQASFLGTRFDTWRSHIENSKIFQGKYSSDYLKYIQELSKSETDAFILEDKDTPSGEVNVPVLKNLVQKNKIKLLIIDGMSYMSDPSGGKNDTDYIKYKNIALDLFRLSKQYGCAVVVAMQANRQTLEQKDDKGECLPTIYNLEGSDHPARIATQVFAVRQIFDKHVLDIRLEKSRNAANQKPILSYAWDVNTGNIRYLPDGENSDQDKSVETVIVKPDIVHRVENEEEIDLDEDEDIEF